MSYVLSTSRNLQIASRITDVDKKDNNNEIDALVQLLKINTAQPNASFLNEFRALKNNNTFVNDLCQRKGVFGSIVYAFRRDNYRAERYKTIMNQLKIGGYNDQYNKKISYFSTASNLQKSLCEKLEEIKNTYLAKTYVSKEDSSSAKVIFDQLQTFNENVGFKTPTYKLMPIYIQCKTDNDTGIWDEFVKNYPEYLCLSQENQNGEEFNINGYSTKSLKQNILATLELDENINLFTDDNKLTKSAGNKIKEQLRKLIQQKVAIKIRDKVRGFQARLRNKPQDDFGNRTMVYNNSKSKTSEKRQRFLFSKNYIGYDITDDNP